MSEEDRQQWDERWADRGIAPDSELGPPDAFAAFADLLPTSGSALEVACGHGRSAVWLALRGLSVLGVDVSPVAVDLAAQLAARHQLSDRCTFKLVDLDGGLPAGDLVDLVLCHMFRDPRLDSEIIDRLKPGAILAIAVLSEVGVGPGRFRSRPGELPRTFGHLEILACGEAEGVAWLIGRKKQSDQSGDGEDRAERA